MKVSVPKTDKKPSTKEILLPLTEDGELYKVDKFNSTEFTLSTNPAGGGTNYKYRARILQGGEPVRFILKWYQDLMTVLEGLGVTGHAESSKLIATVTRGNAASNYVAGMGGLASERRMAAADAARRAAVAAGSTADEQQVAYDNALNTALNTFNRDDDVVIAIGMMMTELMPHNCLARVKRNIRREVRKPVDMKVREYYHHLSRINNEEIPSIPPFDAQQKFSPDEFVDILLYGTPKSWQKEMERQGFDPIQHTPMEVVNFMERIETAEDFDGQKVSHQSNNKKKSSSEKKDNSSYAEGSGKKYCLVHGQGNHSSDECFKLKEEAKRLKGDRSSSKDGSKSKSHNKTWSKKSAESAALSKQELAALITKQVKEGVKKSLASVEKKRKSSEDEDLNAIDLDLNEFNYDLDKLQMDDEVSC